MRARMIVLVSLAASVSPLWAEEVQWRAATPGAPQPPVRPATRPVSLAAPVPAPEHAGGPLGVTPAGFRPVPISQTRSRRAGSSAAQADGPVIGDMTIGDTTQGRPIEVNLDHGQTFGDGQPFHPPLPQPVDMGQPPDSGKAIGIGETTDAGQPLFRTAQEPIEVPTPPTPLPASPENLIAPLDNGGMVPLAPNIGGSGAPGFIAGPGLVAPGYGRAGLAGPGGAGSGGPDPFPFFLGGVSPRNCFYATGELLIWQVERATVPPLLASGNLNNIDNRVLYGNNQIANPGPAGARFGLGVWCPCYPDIGVEIVGFFLGNRATVFGASGNLAVPYIDAATNSAAVLNLTNGSFQAFSTSEFWGIEANGRYKLYQSPIFWIDTIAGYRNLTLNESLTISNQSTGAAVGSNLGTIRTLDQFSTTNSFNAFQSGVEVNWNFWRYFTLGANFKLGLGVVSQTLNISGGNNLTNARQTGGLHALATNIGYRQNQAFGVMPDVGVKLGWNATQRLKFFVGYEFLYLSSVLRASEQVDARINPGLLPNRGGPLQPRAPQSHLNASGFWAQGATIGAIFSW